MVAMGDPLTFFCAAMESVAVKGRGGMTYEEHTLMRRMVPSEAVWEKGRHWLAAYSENELMRQLPEMLNGPQRICLFVNLAALSLADGFLEEAGELSRFREALKIHRYDADQVLRTWKIVYNVKVFNGLTFDGSDAMIVFTVALLGMAHADSEATNLESKFLERVVRDSQAVQVGCKLHSSIGEEGVIDKIGEMLEEQKRCLFANLTVLMLADGQWNGMEQKYLDRVIRRLGLTQRVTNNIMKGIFPRFNMSVFA